MLFPSKLKLSGILAGVESALKKYPTRNTVILGDSSLAQLPVHMFNMELRPASELDQFGYDATTFVYSSDKDDIGSPFIRRIIANDGRFVPAVYGDPSLYVNNDSVARKALEDEYTFQKALGFEKWDFGFHDFVNITQVLNVTSRLEGQYIEIGCYQGSSGGAALRFLKDKKIRRKCFFLDVFEGFNYDAALESADAFWAGTHVTSGYEAVKARLSAYAEGVDGLDVEVHKSNIVTDALPDGADRIVAANIDVDLYEAVLAGLRKVAPLVVRGGIIIVEDAGHTPLLIGARVALDEFLNTVQDQTFVPIYMESGQTLLIKL